MSERNNYQLTHLHQLEAESIFIMREVAAQFGKPALLFSGGKDSIVMVRLAQRRFGLPNFLFRWFMSILGITLMRLFSFVTI